MLPEKNSNFNLRNILLIATFNHTIENLLNYQKSLYLKAAHKTKARKSMTTSRVMQAMPSVEILDFIQLQQQLTDIIRIYEAVLQGISGDPESKDYQENPYKAIDDFKAKQKDNLNELSQEFTANKAKLAEVEKQLLSERKTGEHLLKEKLLKLQTLRNQMQNNKLLYKMEWQLREKWEENRQSQVLLFGEQQESSLRRQKIVLSLRLSGERRQFNEVENFRKIELSDLEEQVEKWQKKFTESNSQIEAKIQKLQERSAAIQSIYEQRLEIYKERTAFIEDYLLMKEREKRWRAQQLYRIECAIRLQAWWRGLMVRLALGPYRKKSKKSKKHKAKK